MPVKKILNTNQVIRAIEKSHGLLYVAANKLGVTYRWMTQYVKNNPKALGNYRIIIGKTAEVAMGNIIREVYNGDPFWSKYWLDKTVFNSQPNKLYTPELTETNMNNALNQIVLIAPEGANFEIPGQDNSMNTQIQNINETDFEIIE